MKVLYVAADQEIPGRTGGSVHVLEVARGLAGRGHDVHAVVRQRPGEPAEEAGDGVCWHRITWRPPHRFFRFRAAKAVEEIGRRVGARVVMERYYNFGGEGVAAARRLGIPSLLEVNSPILDHPGSWKAALDAALLVRPMRAYRERQCRDATALVSPLLEIVPETARAKTEKVYWGANVETFRPGRAPDVRERLGIPVDAVVVVFSGSFRPWHGVHVLEEAARRLVDRSDLFFLLVGGTSGRVTGYRGARIGTLAYDEMPAVLRAADIGVAPYDTTRLGQLQLGFYWSPLKVFESMATGLPTVTIPRYPLTEIVREGEDGLHFEEASADDLAAVLRRLADDETLRTRLGQSGRARVVERYSWARHCAQLETILTRIAA